MITKMGKKAWDFITQGKLVDEWFDTDTVTVNGVVVNRENYGSSQSYNSMKSNPSSVKIYGRETAKSPLHSAYNGDLVQRLMFPYREGANTWNKDTYRESAVACNPFILGNNSSYYSEQIMYFGSSDESTAEDDYWLKSWLQNVWCYGWKEYAALKNGVYTCELSIFNGTENEVTIKEMCSCTGWIFTTVGSGGPSTANTNTGMTEAAAPFIMIDRTVLETPLTIPAKSIGYMVLS